MPNPNESKALFDSVSLFKCGHSLGFKVEFNSSNFDFVPNLDKSEMGLD